MTNAHDLERMAAYHAGDERFDISKLRGAFGWQEGDEPAEVTLRRIRGDADTERRIAALEARIAALEARLNEQDGGK